MKRTIYALLALFLLSTEAVAQWQVPQYSVPIGRGVGRVGFDNTAPGTIDFPLLSNGASAKPTFRAMPFTAAGAGAVTRTMLQKARDVISSLDYAVGTGLVDDTAAIIAGLLATPEGGTFHFECGDYLSIGSGGAIYTRTIPIRVTTDGPCARIMVDSTVPNTRDVFSIVPSANYSGWFFDGLYFITNGGSDVARHIFSFDATANDTVSANLVRITNNIVVGGFNNYAFSAVGTAAGASVFDVELSGNRFDKGGIAFVNAGDTLKVLGNNISDTSTSRAGVYVNQQEGAGNALISGDNNIVTYGTMVKIARAIAPMITYNVMERTALGTDQPLIAVEGDVAPGVSGGVVAGNQLQTLTGRTAIPIRVGPGVVSLAIEHNPRIAVPAGGTHIEIDASAVGVNLGYSNQYYTADIRDVTPTISGTVYSYGLGTSMLGYPFTTASGPTVPTVTVWFNAMSIPGRAANSAGVGSDITATSANQVLKVNGAGTALLFEGIAPDQLASMGAGVATWMITPSSANLAAALTDETGSGSLVFGTVASANTASAIVARDGSGNFAAGTITAALTGNATNITASSNTSLTSLANLATVGTITSGTWTGTTVAVANGGTGDTGTAWTTYTPTATCGSGSATFGTVTGAYKQLGKTVHVRMAIPISANDTCAGNIQATLPIAPISGIEMTIPSRNVTNGGAGAGRIKGDLGCAPCVLLTLYDGAYPGATGANIAVTGVYEAN